jgi:hypothetical protein
MSAPQPPPRVRTPPATSARPATPDPLATLLRDALRRTADPAWQFWLQALLRTPERAEG